MDGNRPFDPQEMQEQVTRLRREGNLPSLPQFLNALKAAQRELNFTPEDIAFLESIGVTLGERPEAQR
jgi:hypothetical protein